MASWRPFAVLTICLFLPPTTGHGQEKGGCISRTRVVQALQLTYGEVPTSVGLADTPDGRKLAFEVLASPTGTWTAIVTTPQGCTTAVAAGTDWVRK